MNMNMNEKIDNILGSIFFVSSIGLVLYRISKYKKIDDHNANYYIINDMNINPSPYLRRIENHTTTTTTNINKEAIRELIKEKIKKPKNLVSSSLSTPIKSSLDKDTVREKILSKYSSPTSSTSSRKKNKDLSSRPTVYAPNPVRNKENSLSTTTTATTTTNNSPNTNSSPITITDEVSISSSPSYFYDITSPMSIQNETISSIGSNQSESFETPQSGQITINEEKNLSNDNVITTASSNNNNNNNNNNNINNNENVWISPIFADVIKWEISNGIYYYVLECRTTRGPVLEWSCNKTMEQFQELKKQLNLLLDLDLDQDNLLSTNQLNNYDNDTTLWHNCSIISKFMMTIMKREDIMKKSSTFHLVTDFLDPDN